MLTAFIEGKGEGSGSCQPKRDRSEQDRHLETRTLKGIFPAGVPSTAMLKKTLLWSAKEVSPAFFGRSEGRRTHEAIRRAEGLKAILDEGDWRTERRQ